jgi:plastocyanin
VSIRTRTAAVLLSVLLVAPAVSPASAQRTRGDVHPRVTVERVRMIDNNYRPTKVTVARGTRIRWVNRGLASHTTTANSGAWDSGLVASGDAWARTFRKAGTFRYHCTLHSAMTGVVVVT